MRASHGHAVRQAFSWARRWKRQASTGGVYLQCSSALLPHPDKRAKGGEDAFFTDEACGAVGVADGVGGWASSGVDPGVFSRRLMRHCHAGLSSQASRSDAPSLRDAISSSAEAFASHETVEGSSTLLLAQLESSGMLQILNVGDSALMVYRPAMKQIDGKKMLWPRLVFRTQEGTYGFNFPYQVSASTLQEECDSNALELHLAVRPGDVILAVTDGVTDNLFDNHLQVCTILLNR